MIFIIIYLIVVLLFGNFLCKCTAIHCTEHNYFDYHRITELMLILSAIITCKEVS